MASAAQLVDALMAEGYDFFAGVPCSILDGVIRTLQARPELGYVPAVREDLAVGMACGAWLAGRKPVLFMQNSGFENSLNAITSLLMIYRIPVLLVVSYRGFQGKDAPEHVVMGRLTEPFLELLGTPWRMLEPGDVAEPLQDVGRRMASTGQPGVLVVRDKVLS